ncbi:hypothetical protein LDENG_00190960 [Lucifuga dentata]|nr:hypothetical protein LDENG_00190960 [Lucifuga dentata]
MAVRQLDLFVTYIFDLSLIRNIKETLPDILKHRKHNNTVHGAPMTTCNVLTCLIN